MEFPVFLIPKSQLRPTAMLAIQKPASMDVEESIRGLPMDGVVLLVGCDKTTPALMMGVTSCDLPTIAVSGGPMLNGRHSAINGSGTHTCKFSEMVKAGEMTLEEFMSAEQDNSKIQAGHCMTMGTASTSG